METVSKIELNVDYMQKGLAILSQIFLDLYFYLVTKRNSWLGRLVFPARISVKNNNLKKIQFSITGFTEANLKNLSDRYKGQDGDKV